MRKPAEWFAEANARREQLEQKMALSPTQKLDPAEETELSELQHRCDEELQRCYTNRP